MNKTWSMIFNIICYVLVGFVIGKMSVSLIAPDAHLFVQELIILVLAFVMLCVQIVLHECGHLLAGLLSGYRFSSIRIGCLQLCKEKDRFVFKYHSLPGTAGQCLMQAPEYEDGNFPFVLYNMGGALMNLLVAGISFWIASILSPCMGKHLLFCFGASGICTMLVNGIPMHMELVNNDGFNTMECLRSEQARRAFWVGLKITHATAAGIRCKDMPEEWFHVPSDLNQRECLSSILLAFAENRAMDEHDFDRALQWIDEADLRSDYMGINGLLMKLDANCIHMYRGEETKELSKKERGILKSLKAYPAVLRYEYCHALLQERDSIKANEIKKKFYKLSRKYPYPAEIETELELMNYAENIVA